MRSGCTEVRGAVREAETTRSSDDSVADAHFTRGAASRQGRFFAPFGGRREAAKRDSETGESLCAGRIRMAICRWLCERPGRQKQSRRRHGPTTAELRQSSAPEPRRCVCLFHRQNECAYRVLSDARRARPTSDDIASLARRWPAFCWYQTRFLLFQSPECRSLAPHGHEADSTRRTRHRPPAAFSPLLKPSTPTDPAL